VTVYGRQIVNNDGTPFVAGDQFGVQRSVPGIPTGRSLTKAWLTIKVKPSDADPGVLQKVITTAASGAGQITQDGSPGQGAGTGTILFVFTATDTGTTIGADTRLLYDIQVKFDDGEIVTLEEGTIELRAGLTAAAS